MNTIAFLSSSRTKRHCASMDMLQVLISDAIAVYATISFLHGVSITQSPSYSVVVKPRQCSRHSSASKPAPPMPHQAKSRPLVPMSALTPHALY